MTKEDKTELTEQEQVFLDLLFKVDENGICQNPEEAKLRAGYDKSASIHKIVAKIKKFLLEQGDNALALYSPIAIQGLLSVLNDPTAPGAKVRLQAAAELLDRGGITKKERTEQTLEAPNFVFVLPNKKPID